MKAILKFNLPEDDYDYKLANNAQKMHTVLWEMSQWLRSKVKYAPDDMSEEEYRAYENCRNELLRLLEEENVLLD